MIRFKYVLSLFFVIMLLGCQEKVERGASKIHWDRDMCDRCVMVISDRKNTVQLKDSTTGKVYKFDDIGCMAIWFRDEQIAFKDSAAIWVTDVKTGEWIDARAAFYTTGNLTPMAFGFSAYKSKESIKDTDEIISYDEVLKRIK
ncbi:MAG: nitrous oxide reductase accessory protein NosL [Sulfurimonas sp.]|nr:nitrous oxide reductase accessory protein NosL [Sulfurimonas sp.]